MGGEAMQKKLSTEVPWQNMEQDRKEQRRSTIRRRLPPKSVAVKHLADLLHLVEVIHKWPAAASCLGVSLLTGVEDHDRANIQTHSTPRSILRR